jgi:aldoxime dehydratase
MEFAIPVHLRTERIRPRRIPDDYMPPVPAYVARFKPGVSRVVTAYFGIQYRGEEPASARTALAWMIARFAAVGGPAHWDRARYLDEADYTNVLLVGYWNDRAAFEEWMLQTREWTAEHFLNGLGRFVEVLTPSVTGYETLFSSLGRPEGVAVLADGMSGEIQEHAYWGGMRDRIPLSQTDDMAPEGAVRFVRDGSSIRVVPNDNLCLIRSGQDWTDTESAERETYVRDVEPVLREGMDFLRDEGKSIGCFANRYMTVLDSNGRPVEKTYGMSWWKSLAALERWAESHPTHVAIFGAAMKYMMKLGPTARLRLYHEVIVARANEQFFEYFKCHDRTGMLKAVDLG